MGVSTARNWFGRRKPLLLALPSDGESSFSEDIGVRLVLSRRSRASRYVIIDHVIRVFEACPGIPLLEEGYYTHIKLVADEFGKLFIIAIAAVKVTPPLGSSTAQIVVLSILPATSSRTWNYALEILSFRSRSFALLGSVTGTA